jgi:hypothetical protein
MKILFIGNNAVLPDYLHDSVFHGLRELYGETVVDANKLWYLYKDADLFNQQNFENIRKPLHGWGYTYGGNLNNLNIDRTDIILIEDSADTIINNGYSDIDGLTE